MSRYLSKLKTPQLGVLFLILILSFSLRFHNYAQFPVGGETMDEYAWTFLGASLIQNKEPTSWSHFSDYQQVEEIELGKNKFKMVTPALDHPPLFSLIPGFAHSLLGDWRELASLKVIRFPMVLIGVLNVFLLVIFTNLLTKNRSIATLSGLLYATIPLFVFSSRLVVAENLLTTIFLIALIVNHSVTKQRNLLLIVLSCLAILCKISGVILPVALVLYGLHNRENQLVKSGIIGFILGIGLFALYGWFFDWQIFTAILGAQSGRDIGFATIQNRLFLHPSIVDKIFMEGWLVLGLIAAFFSWGKQKSFQLADFLLLTTLLFIFATVGESTFHGWYNYVIFPILSIYLAHMFEYIWSKQQVFLFASCWLLLIVSVEYISLVKLPELNSMIYRLFYGLGLLPLFLSWLGNDNLVKGSMATLFTILIVANISTVIIMTDQLYWIQDEYFRPSYIVK